MACRQNKEWQDAGFEPFRVSVNLSARQFSQQYLTDMVERTLLEDPNDAAIVTAIIAMVQNLSLKVTSEGVETAEQLEFLRSLKCDEIQGYIFSRPLPADKLTKLLAQGMRFCA
ncbi:MAG TPA: EAL domain-containing protein [Candidatus Aquicultor sp.]|jgi:EAL domain-containing protein (putative c-di-GMP-specific phosphodiesterase class I)